MNHLPEDTQADDAAEIRILLLEDSDIDAELLCAHLQKDGMTFAMTRAKGRADFLAALDGTSYDIILADYALPDFDGLLALSLAQEICPDIPFILVSGMQGEEFATGALKRGAIDYVMKRNISRLPTSIRRAMTEARERAIRRKAESAVRALNVNLEALVESRTAERDRIWRLSRDLFAVSDGRGCFTAANPAWARVLGYDEALIVSRSFTDLAHPDDMEATKGFVASLAEGSPAERFEMRVRRTDGEYRWIAWTAVSEGNTIYSVGRDITAEKQATEQLASANTNLKNEIDERERIEETLRQMQRLEAVGQLTSGVAHDFNNLLTIIVGNVSFLLRKYKEETPHDKTRQRLENIRDAADRGAKLTAQLLAFSRRQRLAPKSINVNDTVAGMRDLLRSTTGGKVRLDVVLLQDLWAALVDPTQVEMIVLNLAINARDAMPNGGRLRIETSNVRITAAPRRAEEPAPGEYICLLVSDTGTGMSEDVAAKAFEPFFTTKGPSKGSGLGLAQVFGSAKQSGGGVRLDTRDGEGTDVRVYFPRASEIAISPPEVAKPAERRSDGELTALVVDDDDAVRDITVAMIQDLGYRVLEADSGVKALETLRTARADIVIADYAMPGMNGQELILAARGIWPKLPALLVTGYADLNVTKTLGEQNVLQKPFQAEELAKRIALALKGEDPLTGDGQIIPFVRR